MRTHAILRDALPYPVLEHMREGCLGSPLVGTSPLAGTFRASQGFAATFRRDGKDELLERFGFLRAFVELVLGGEGEDVLFPLYSRLGRARANAFYLNLLLLRRGAGVGAHVDATLREASGVPTAVPRLVTVLYLVTSPGAKGGELVLHHGKRPVLALAPEPGLLLHFRGKLSHEVRRLTPLDEAPVLRASLVCEQYHFDKAALARLPACRVHSKAGFSAYLEAARAVPADVELED